MFGRTNEGPDAESVGDDESGNAGEIADSGGNGDGEPVVAIDERKFHHEKFREIDILRV